jgi:hypothetical protein
MLQGENWTKRKFITLTLRRVLLRESNEDYEMDGACSTHGTLQTHTEFLLEYLDKNHSEDVTTEGRQQASLKRR